jgi:hypothetical protein
LIPTKAVPPVAAAMPNPNCSWHLSCSLASYLPRKKGAVVESNINVWFLFCITKIEL